MSMNDPLEQEILREMHSKQWALSKYPPGNMFYVNLDPDNECLNRFDLENVCILHRKRPPFLNNGEVKYIGNILSKKGRITSLLMSFTEKDIVRNLGFSLKDAIECKKEMEKGEIEQIKNIAEKEMPHQ